MSSFRPYPFLRYALIGDALVSGATGLLTFAGAGLLAEPLGIPVPLLRSAALVLLPYAAFVGWLGTRNTMAPRIVWAVVAINALWALDSIALLASGWIAPSALGTGFIVFQAAGVAGFAAAQAYGLRSQAFRRAAHA